MTSQSWDTWSYVEERFKVTGEWSGWQLLLAFPTMWPLLWDKGLAGRNKQKWETDQHREEVMAAKFCFSMETNSIFFILPIFHTTGFQAFWPWGRGWHELKSAFRLMTRYKFKKHLNYFHSIGFDTWISFVFILGCYFFPPYSFSQVQQLCIIMHFPSLASTSMQLPHFSRDLPRPGPGGKGLKPYLVQILALLEFLFYCCYF